MTTPAEMFSHGVTIAGQPVISSYQTEIQEWLDQYARVEELFQNVESYPCGHLSSNESTVFANPYPALPPLRLGQVQWPTGLQRYGRALFAVDWWTLAFIAKQAWGYTVPTSGGDQPTAYQPDEAPADWGSTGNTVKLRMQFEDMLEIDMYALTPFRVTTKSFDLWILPLVDKRFDWIRQYGSLATDWSGEYPWAAMFNEAKSAIGITSFEAGSAIPSSYGTPDRICRSESVPLVKIVDTAALSVGRRVVVDTDYTVRLHETPAAAARVATLATKNCTAGGLSGKINRPKKLKVRTRRIDDLYSGFNQWETYDSDWTGGSGDQGPELPVFSLWNVYYKDNALDTTFPDQTEFRAYIDLLAVIWRTWLAQEHYYCISGFTAYQPSGFDDYVIWEFADELVTTRVKSLGQRFAPNFLIAQGSHEGGFYAPGGTLEAKVAVAGIAQASARTSPVFGQATVYDFSGGHVGPSAGGSGVAMTRKATVANTWTTSGTIPLNGEIQISANETLNGGSAHPTPWRIVGYGCGT